MPVIYDVGDVFIALRAPRVFAAHPPAAFCAAATRDVAPAAPLVSTTAEYARILLFFTISLRTRLILVLSISSIIKYPKFWLLL